MSLHHLPAGTAVAPGRRRLVRAVLTAVLAAVALALAGHAPAAHACAADPDTGETTCGPPPPPPPKTCPSAPAKWSTQPRVVVHVSEFRATGGAAADQVLLMGAAYDVMNQFNAMGATSARITSVTSTTDPFGYQKAYADSVPTIHVGFAPMAKITADNPKGEPAAGLTSERYMGSTCQPAVTIEFPDDNLSTRWSFSSPLTSVEITKGALFFDAGATDPSGATWFRPSLLHETLHAFDLNHTATQYSMMNHRGDGGFPWANRPDPEAVRPLPDEIGLLRAAYPATGTRWDVAVLNNWFGETPDSKGGAADQLKLCLPSLGSSWSGETSSGACGVDGGKDGSTTVGSPGSSLRTRFTLANYSTGSLDVTSRLWLSKDDTWDPSDVLVDAEQSDHLNGATSAPVKAKWTLPELCSDDYRPIVRVVAMHINADGAADPASVKTDWIPLRGKIKSTWLCKLQL